MLTEKLQKVAPEFFCEKCNYNTSKKSSYDKHLLTAKHKMLTNDYIKVAKSCSEFICCKCNKIYKSRVGLYLHKKKCSLVVENPAKVQQKLENTMVLSDPSLTPLKNSNGIPFDSSTKLPVMISNDAPSERLISNDNGYNLSAIVLDLLKQNNELQKQLIELSKEKSIVMNNCTTNGNTNNMNNHFNIQVFLNDKCKDAINIDQFIKDIQISITDLENVGNQGYVQGISDIIIKNLRTLELTKRPMHCTDIKRETIYIKDADKWEKDSEDKPKIKNVINRVAKKNLAKIQDWYKDHPEVTVLDSKDYEMNHKLIRQSFGDGDLDVLQNKVVKHLVKEVYVDKTSNSIV